MTIVLISLTPNAFNLKVLEASSPLDVIAAEELVNVQLGKRYTYFFKGLWGRFWENQRFGELLNPQAMLEQKLKHSSEPCVIDIQSQSLTVPKILGILREAPPENILVSHAYGAPEYNLGKVCTLLEDHITYACAQTN